ncbi:hypothetical protein GGS23DRAFT_600763 [Durotheca rogersii]|uniref:uncharacterized protein n=1 Tax=Durotheca rogersii TaxID=419775 RepID=UPI00221F0039|nr:uncharacterized protein GGS23DRAFT_600763 [Durotheca rogersii]KAI5857429.1 hypothetical protein GGS23DRAFT_600763 [Durotheca rogersii]
MLQALDYSAAKHHFVLGDFGLCCSVADSTSFFGTKAYMAPKLVCGGAQTVEIDVWSLMATMPWAVDVDKFREMLAAIEAPGDAQGMAVRAALCLAAGPKIVRIDPAGRASAVQMLVKFFDGKGPTRLDGESQRSAKVVSRLRARRAHLVRRGLKAHTGTS